MLPKKTLLKSNKLISSNTKSLLEKGGLGLKKSLIKKEEPKEEFIDFDDFEEDERLTNPSKSEFESIQSSDEKEEVSNKIESVDSEEFLAGLRDFMDDYSNKELGLYDIGEPASMTAEQANQFVKLVRRAEEEKAKINTICDNELDRISKAVNLYRENNIMKLDKQIEYFQSILKQYLIGEIADKKKKSIKLPYGTLAIKNVPPKYDYKEEDSVKKHLEEYADKYLVSKTTVNIDKNTLKKEGVVKDGGLWINGIRVPGIIVEEQEPKFEVKLPK